MGQVQVARVEFGELRRKPLQANPARGGSLAVKPAIWQRSQFVELRVYVKWI